MVFILLALLSFVVDFRDFSLLIITEGGDSCGISVQADTPQELCSEEDWRMPHGKRSPAVKSTIPFNRAILLNGYKVYYSNL